MSQNRGILPAHEIEALHGAGAIRIAAPFATGQVQPASLDLRLGSRAWRMRASFLPGPERPVSARIEALALHEIDLTQGAVLETGCVYIAELMESLALPAEIAASANPKSSTGRIDVFTRVIADRAHEFDQIEAGYDGKLYAEISPRTFPVLVRSGSRLSQVRFRRGQARLDDQGHLDLHKREKLVTSAEPSISGGVAVSVDLAGFDGSRSAIAPSGTRASSMSTSPLPMPCSISGSPFTGMAAPISCSIPANSTSSPLRKRCACRPTTRPR